MPTENEINTSPAYPDKLCDKEAELVRGRRREVEGVDADSEKTARETISDSVGLACSGGGIRSATFCLGVGQALAEKGLLKHFDFISTVSGGGYFGSFLSRLIQRRGSVAGAEAELKDSDSWSIRWLRENGYYLTPGGTSDVWMILAQVVRNWGSIHVALFGVFALPFLFGNALRSSFQNWGFFREIEPYFIPSAGAVWAWSPWLLLLVVLVVVGMLIPSVFYWGTLLFPKGHTQQNMQKSLTRYLGTGLLLAVVTALVSLVDMAGLWIYMTIRESTTFTVGVGVVYATAAAGFMSVQKFAGKLTELAGSKKKKLPMKTVANLAGFVWALLFWIALATLGHLALWQGKHPCGVNLAEHERAYWIFAVAWLAAVCVISQAWGFTNLSSHNRFYTSRLRRAYLGAANENRQKEEQRISENHPDDDDLWTDHQPHEFGGPLHIVNTTVNETISGKSQVEQRDRKGISLAVGPAGMSAGGWHHALWAGGEKKAAEVPISAIPYANSFRIFPSGDYSVEELTVGQWMGVSGAAFSTGTGANTSLGLSLLLGFANVRLGYWWDSKKGPTDRVENGRGWSFSRAITRLMPAPHSLVDEMLARFHGPVQRHWYLSDGGHFENTACYELIRRRVRFILCLDCGQDDAMSFEDIANLTRKARIDYGAELNFLAGDEAKAALAEVGNRGWVPEINEGLIGMPEAFAPVKNTDGYANPDTGKAHALLARVTYSDGEPSVILFLKPSLLANMPVDIQHYHRANPDFPQQSTADQFFDEAQWESYRSLGQHIARAVLSIPTRTQ